MTSHLTKNFKSVLSECFSTDPILVEKYHISAGEGLEACVEKTFEDLMKANVSFYVVSSEKETIGFFGIEHIDNYKALTGFFIKPEYRSLKKDFWKTIQKTMDNKSFLCGVYNKNTRAIKFLKEMGGIPALSVPSGTIFKVT